MVDEVEQLRSSAVMGWVYENLGTLAWPIFLGLFLVVTSGLIIFLYIRSLKKLASVSKGGGGSLHDLLAATQLQFSKAFKDGSTKQDIDFLEERLYECDLSPAIIEKLVRHSTLSGKVFDISMMKENFRRQMQDILSTSKDFHFSKQGPPQVWLFIGSNGVGKTTTISKVAYGARAQGLKVLLVAGDTFRAAAREQLALWCEHLGEGVDIFSDSQIKDPAALAYQALQKIRDYDLILVDTAGRLQTKVSLMDELKKMKRVLHREVDKRPSVKLETILVLDGSSGRSALNQARVFHKEVGVSSLIMTKLDGSFRGGALISIVDELKLPVLALGTGEKKEDLQPFQPSQFIDFIL